MKAINPQILLVAVALVAVAYMVKKASDAASSVGTMGAELAHGAAVALNPTDPGNLANSLVNYAGSAWNTAPDAAGKNADGSWSLGGWIYDKTHSDVFNPENNSNTSTSPPAAVSQNGLLDVN